MNLIIDIGNTCAKLALFHNGEIVGDIVRTDSATINDLPDLVKAHPTIDKAIVSSVVTLSQGAKKRLSELPCKVLTLDHTTPLPVGPQYHFPKEMGSDRIASDVAAILRSPGKTILVFDAGTCLTSELLHPVHGVLGGTISPGLRLRLISMHEHTSALPLITSRLVHNQLLGTDTHTAMLAGAVNSITFEIEGYIRRITDKIPDLAIYFTGGDSFSFDNSIKPRIIQDKLLLLRGLNDILEFNEL